LSTNKAIFIDRDGTLVKEVWYLSDEKQLELKPTVPEALKMLREYGFLIVIVTNQSVIGRGIIDHEKLRVIHERLQTLLQQKGARYDHLYYCPHLPEEGCSCRKPAPGLILKAAEDLHIDLKSSFVVGDRLMDVKAAKSLGVRCAVVISTWSSLDGDVRSWGADFIGENLLEVAEWIIRQEQRDTRS